MGPIADKPELLDALLSDASRVPEQWRPAAFWQHYIERIVSEIRRAGLAAFQSNYRICKGYGAGGPPEPIGPVAGYRKLVWSALVRTPPFDRIVAEYRRMLDAQHLTLRSAQIRFSRVAIEAVRERFPALRIAQGLDNGAADDSFDFNGAAVTTLFVEQLCRLADFYARVAPSELRSIVELGPGLGFSTLAHLAFNPHLRLVVNIDIAPPLYVSTQFLRASGELEVIDYLDVRGPDRVEPAAGGDRPRIYQLPPWTLPKLSGRFDYFFNAYSFQEMNRAICENYARELVPHIDRGVLLHSNPVGSAHSDAGGRGPVSMEFLVDLFRPHFPCVRELDGLWNRFWQRDPAHVVLLQRH